jgi:hypothetical protein
MRAQHNLAHYAEPLYPRASDTLDICVQNAQNKLLVNRGASSSL